MHAASGLMLACSRLRCQRSLPPNILGGVMQTMLFSSLYKLKGPMHVFCVRCRVPVINAVYFRMP